MLCHHRLFLSALVLSLSACRSTGAGGSGEELAAVQRALGDQEVVQLAEYGLHADRVERESDSLRLEGIRVFAADGEQLEADAGTLVDQGDTWRLTLSNASSADARGNATRMERATLVWAKGKRAAGD